MLPTVFFYGAETCGCDSACRVVFVCPRCLCVFVVVSRGSGHGGVCTLVAAVASGLAVHFGCGQKTRKLRFSTFYCRFFIIVSVYLHVKSKLQAFTFFYQN